MDVFNNRILNESYRFSKTSCSKQEYKTYRLKKGDLLLTPSSENKTELGLPSLINFDRDNIVYSYHLILFRTNENLIGSFATLLFISDSSQKYFYENASGLTRFVVSKTSFENLPLTLPTNLTEQQKIASLFTNLDNLIENTKIKFNKLSNLKQSLLNNMFI